MCYIKKQDRQRRKDVRTHVNILFVVAVVAILTTGHEVSWGHNISLLEGLAASLREGEGGGETNGYPL